MLPLFLYFCIFCFTSSSVLFISTLLQYLLIPLKINIDNMYKNVCLLKTSNKNSLSFIEVSHYDSGTHVRRISAPWTGTHRLRAEPDQHRPDTLSSSVWRVAQGRNKSYFILSCILLTLTWPHLQPRTTPPVSQGLPERTGEDFYGI